MTDDRLSKRAALSPSLFTPHQILYSAPLIACIVERFYRLLVGKGVQEVWEKKRKKWKKKKVRKKKFTAKIKGALYRIWCGVSRLGDSGVIVV